MIAKETIEQKIMGQIGHPAALIISITINPWVLVTYGPTLNVGGIASKFNVAYFSNMYALPYSR